MPVFFVIGNVKLTVKYIAITVRGFSGPAQNQCSNKPPMRLGLYEVTWTVEAIKGYNSYSCKTAVLEF